MKDYTIRNFDPATDFNILHDFLGSGHRCIYIENADGTHTLDDYDNIVHDLAMRHFNVEPEDWFSNGSEDTCDIDEKTGAINSNLEIFCYVDLSQNEEHENVEEIVFYVEKENLELKVVLDPDNSDGDEVVYYVRDPKFLIMKPIEGE